MKTMLDKSSNPVFSDKVFKKDISLTNGKVMTVNGTIEKTGLLLLILMVAAAYTWKKFFNSGDIENAAAQMQPWIMGGAIGGFAVAMATIFLKKYAAFLTPIYAILEGLFLGALSALFESMYPGIVMNAVMATFATFLVMLLSYRTGLIKVTDKLRSVVVIATGAIAVTYLLSWILGMFGIPMNFLHSNGAFGIGISVVVIIVAALNLLLDFDFIDRNAQMGVPKYMEWFSAFGLLVTLVWLYIEFLRLLSKLRD